MADENKCKHNGCTCQKGQDSDYCSDYCENAGDSNTSGPSCKCGHPNC